MKTIKKGAVKAVWKTGWVAHKTYVLKLIDEEISCKIMACKLLINHKLKGYLKKVEKMDIEIGCLEELKKRIISTDKEISGTS